MAFQEGTENFICLACGALHVARWYRMPVKDRALIKCHACRSVILDRNGLRDYFDVKLV